MDKEMLKLAAYGPVAGYIVSSLINDRSISDETIIDRTVELTKAIVDRIYA